MFKRKGIPDAHVALWPDHPHTEKRNFGIPLDLEEEPVLMILSDDEQEKLWLTTRRVVWRAMAEQHVVNFDDIEKVLTSDFTTRRANESENLRIWTKTGRTYDIHFPNPGILAGMWSILHHFAMRS